MKSGLGRAALEAQKMNDRDGLIAAEKAVLDEKILPTARRWLRQYPGLRGHAISTLNYWGEPLVDDMGNHFGGNREGRGK